MTAKQESDLLITSMITDRIGQHEVLLPIIKTVTKSEKKVTVEFECFGEKKNNSSVCFY